MYNVDSAVITDRFDIGVDVLTVIAETVEEGCIDYEVMGTLDAFEWHMRNVEGVQSVRGLAGTARSINAMWNEGSLKWRALPRNHYMLVQSVSPVPTSSGLLNLDCSVMPVSIYTTDHKAETIERIVAAVKGFDAANPNERITFRLASGNVGVMAATNEEVEASQFPILAYVYAAVIVLCLLSFRSVAATVCIIVPLAVVSLLAYALMALLEIGLKVSTLPVVALGVGIGVDYGIYIYGRLRTHLAQGLDFAAAYERTLATTGAGVVLTGLTLGGGGDLDRGAAEVPGRHGHGSDVHVPGQHDRSGGAAAGARCVAGPPGENEDRRDMSGSRHRGDRLRGKDVVGAHAVIPAKAGSGDPQADFRTPRIPKVQPVGRIGAA